LGEQTRNKETICVICKKPITKAQRPPLRLEPGKEAHMECYAKRQKNAGRPN